MRKRWLLILLFCLPGYTADSDDVILRAMRAEIERARGLTFANLESPYYVEADINDTIGFSASATLGGLLSANRLHHRSPQIEVRPEIAFYHSQNGPAFNGNSNKGIAPNKSNEAIWSSDIIFHF